jgi:phosphohistidine phosphatase
MTSTLLLLRHGIAEDAGPAIGYDDELRALTEEGAARMRAAAAGMAALDLGVDTIVSSPLVRCRQTGEIVAAALGLGLAQDARLAPGMDIDGVEDLLIERPDARTVLLCGHQPDLSHLVAALTAGGSVEFRKGSLAVLTIEALRRGGGRLRALYPPASLRGLAAPAG